MTETHSSDRVPAEAARVGHEMSDVNLGGVVVFALGLVITLVVLYLVLWMLFAFLAETATRRAVRQYPLAAGRQERLPPSPRLQLNPREDLRELRSAEDAVLNSYGWLDRNGGVVHIPIDEAMKLAVQRGLPARGKP
jgi:hypothetical protein